MANSSRTFKTERGSVGGSGRAHNLSRQICIVSSSATFVNNDPSSNERMISLLWLYVQSAKPRVLDHEIRQLFTFKTDRLEFRGLDRG